MQRDQAPAPTTDIDIQFVVCVVAGERYGIEVGRVHEIIRLTAITTLPGADRSFGGVINLRGRVIPVMNLRHRLGLPDDAPTRHSRIVVADAGGTQIGLVVDAVNEVAHVATSTIDPTPAVTDSAAAGHLSGVARVADGLIVILDIDRLLGNVGLADSTDPEAAA